MYRNISFDFIPFFEIKRLFFWERICKQENLPFFTFHMYLPMSLSVRIILRCIHTWSKSINYSFSFPSPQWLGVTMTKGCLWQLAMKFTLVGSLHPLLPYSYWVVSRFTIRSRIQIKFNFCHSPADSRISLECYSLRQSGYVFIYRYRTRMTINRS